MSTYTPFEEEVLSKLNQLTGDVSELKTSVYTIEKRLDTMDERLGNLDDKTDALWTLSNQSFSAISEIRNEVNPPWRSAKGFQSASR